MAEDKTLYLFYLPFRMILFQIKTKQKKNRLRRWRSQRMHMHAEDSTDRWQHWMTMYTYIRMWDSIMHLVRSRRGPAVQRTLLSFCSIVHAALQNKTHSPSSYFIEITLDNAWILLENLYVCVCMWTNGDMLLDVVALFVANNVAKDSAANSRCESKSTN